MGGGLLAKAVRQVTLVAQADRIRGQARSYSGSALAEVSGSGMDLWGAACWRMRWVRWNGRHRQIAFAGKRAPTVDLGWLRFRRRAQDLWGSACWRMRWVRWNERHRQVAFAGKRAPTVDLRWLRFPGQAWICGGRLGGEGGGSGGMGGTGRSHSRASALLQWIWVGGDCRSVGAGLLANALCLPPNLPMIGRIAGKRCPHLPKSRM